MKSEEIPNGVAISSLLSRALDDRRGSLNPFRISRFVSCPLSLVSCQSFGIRVSSFDILPLPLSCNLSADT